MSQHSSSMVEYNVNKLEATRGIDEWCFVAQVSARSTPPLPACTRPVHSVGTYLTVSDQMLRASSSLEPYMATLVPKGDTSVKTGVKRTVLVRPN